MSKLVLLNAFSINMIAKAIEDIEQIEHDRGVFAWIGKCSLEQFQNAVEGFVQDNVDIVNAVGHEDTWNIISNMLGDIAKMLPSPQRWTLNLAPGDHIFVFQYVGDRLPQGATELPLGARIDLYSVTLTHYPHDLVEGLREMK
jgi:hypothetical protein